MPRVRLHSPSIGASSTVHGISALPFVSVGERVEQSVLVDTCAWIDQMQGRAPDLAEQLVAARTSATRTVAMQGLQHNKGR